MATFVNYLLIPLLTGYIMELPLVVTLKSVHSIIANVEELKGIADFRSVRLSWKFNSTITSGFAVEYCELVSWGKDKCITQFINNSMAADTQFDTNIIDPTSPRHYEIVIGGLRLATNYSFDVRPLSDGRPSSTVRGRSLKSNDIIVSTKGFSANPRSCLGDRSEIDVETGPFFGGRISIEGAKDRRCTWIGDPRDPSFIHTFTINHEVCGGNKKADRMENIIIVTESRSIITHTARRFMVVCYLLPETYTIKASLQIPSNPNPTEDEISNDVASEDSVDFSGLKSEEMLRIAKYPDSKMMSSRHTAELEQVAHLFEDNQKETTTAHLVLMIILVVAAAIGVTTTVWWFIGGTRPKKLPMPNLCLPSIVGEDNSSDDGKLVFVSNKDDDGEVNYPYTLNVAEAYGKSECATTFVLAPSMNMAFRTLGDSNC